MQTTTATPKTSRRCKVRFMDMPDLPPVVAAKQCAVDAPAVAAAKERAAERLSIEEKAKQYGPLVTWTRSDRPGICDFPTFEFFSPDAAEKAAEQSTPYVMSYNPKQRRYGCNCLGHSHHGRCWHVTAFNSEGMFALVAADRRARIAEREAVAGTGLGVAVMNVTEDF